MQGLSEVYWAAVRLCGFHERGSSSGRESSKDLRDALMSLLGCSDEEDVHNLSCGGATMSIPGIPGASNPSFRTRDRLVVSLDQLIVEICEELRSQGLSVAPFVAKTIVQLARKTLAQSPGDVDMEALSETVFQELKLHRILVIPARVRLVVQAYGQVFSEMQIEDTVEGAMTGS